MNIIRRRPYWKVVPCHGTISWLLRVSWLSSIRVLPQHCLFIQDRFVYLEDKTNRKRERDMQRGMGDNTSNQTLKLRMHSLTHCSLNHTRGTRSPKRIPTGPAQTKSEFAPTYFPFLTDFYHVSSSCWLPNSIITNTTIARESRNLTGFLTEVHVTCRQT